MKKKMILAIVTTIILGSWLSWQQTWAEEKPYPTRQINYLICFDPGGQSDRVARLHQPHLERILGQKVLIDYKVGGGGCPWLERAGAGKARWLFHGRVQYPSYYFTTLAARSGL